MEQIYDAWSHLCNCLCCIDTTVPDPPLHKKLKKQEVLYSLPKEPRIPNKANHSETTIRPIESTTHRPSEKKVTTLSFSLTRRKRQRTIEKRGSLENLAIPLNRRNTSTILSKPFWRKARTQESTSNISIIMPTGDQSTVGTVGSDPLKGLEPNPICDPFWSCLLQDYSDGEEEEKRRPTRWTIRRKKDDSKRRKQKKLDKKASSKKAKSKAEEPDRYTSLTEY